MGIASPKINDNATIYPLHDHTAPLELLDDFRQELLCQFLQLLILVIVLLLAWVLVLLVTGVSTLLWLATMLLISILVSTM